MLFDIYYVLIDLACHSDTMSSHNLWHLMSFTSFEEINILLTLFTDFHRIEVKQGMKRRGWGGSISIQE